MSSIESRSILEQFYSEYKIKSAGKVLMLMIFSFGFYFINWIYLVNLRFSKFDKENSPNPKRGLVIMFLIPFSWLLIMGVLKRLIFRSYVEIMFWIDVVGWILIILLFLQYLYDFCICFGKFTLSNGFVWYLFLWVGFFPLVLIPFKMYYFLPILFFPVISIPAMQEKLNFEADRFHRVESNRVYYKVFGTRKLHK